MVSKATFNVRRAFSAGWFVLFLAFGAVVQPAAAEKTELSLERIFAADDFRARSFGPALWRADLGGYTLLEKTAAGSEIVLYRPGRSRRVVLVPARRLVDGQTGKSLAIEEYSWSADGRWVMIFTNSQPVWRQNTRGDYWVLNVRTNRLWKLGGDARPSSLMFAKFSPDGSRVAYVYENNIYAQLLADDPARRRIAQLTRDGSKTVINGTFDWVYEEEFHLKDGFRWAPDGRHIAYWQLDSSGVGVFHLINNTDSLYPELIPIPYPKAGTTNSACRVGVVGVEGGGTRWLEFPGDPRDHYIPRMDWAGTSDEIVVQRLNRLQNTNQLVLFNIATGVSRTVMTEKDEAWLDAVDDLQWLDGGKRFTWTSDRDGWQHIYVVSRNGESMRCLTPGAYDVIDVVKIDERNGWVYFTASPENPTQKYLYRVSLTGEGKLQRLTPVDMPGTHNYRVSDDARWAFHTRSSFGVPPQTNLISLRDHRTVGVLEDNAKLRANLERIDRPSAEFFDIAIGAGVTLNAWCIKPPDFDAKKRYPLLFYVYGEPWSQTVSDGWNRSYPWYALLARRGYLIMSVDNRGTPKPRGREWRKCVYRKIGALTAADQAAAVRAIIAARSYVDPERIGVWGWSGGGSQTLDLMFQYPDLYRVGMAVAPVPDMLLYDTIYQERYMGLPQDNPEGYRNGSPVHFAHQLKGDLLIVHGTGDDNVHYQGSERLINALIEADKPFTMMAYPNRSHGIREGKNTTLHLYRLLTRYLLEHLEPGERRQRVAAR